MGGEWVVSGRPNLMYSVVGLSSIGSVYSRSMQEDISIMTGQKGNTQNNWQNR